MVTIGLVACIHFVMSLVSHTTFLLVSASIKRYWNDENFYESRYEGNDEGT